MAPRCGGGTDSPPRFAFSRGMPLRLSPESNHRAGARAAGLFSSEDIVVEVFPKNGETKSQRLGGLPRSPGYESVWERPAPLPPVTLCLSVSREGTADRGGDFLLSVAVTGVEQD